MSYTVIAKDKGVIAMCSGKDFIKEAYYAIYQNDFQKAIYNFKKAIKCEPNNASYYYKLSITHARNGEITDALEAAKKAHELQANSQIYRYHLQILQSKYLVMIAVDRLKQGKGNDQIEEKLLQAKKLDPLNIEACLLLGIYYGEKGLINKALKEFNHVLQLDPNNKEAKKLKAYYIKL